MSAVIPTATPSRRRSSGACPPRNLPTRDAAPTPTPAPSVRSHGRGGTVLFEIPFTSEMNDADLARLARLLDLWTHMHPKMRPDPNSPGVARLDHFSGLFLERGPEAGQWMLQARTWGTPAPESVHQWHVLAAQAARQLDPCVRLPERLPTAPADTAGRPLGHAADGRLAPIRRHIVGLP